MIVKDRDFKVSLAKSFLITDYYTIEHMKSPYKIIRLTSCMSLLSVHLFWTVMLHTVSSLRLMEALAFIFYHLIIINLITAGFISRSITTFPARGRSIRENCSIPWHNFYTGSLPMAKI